MRVAMYYNNRDVRVEEMPRPQIGPGELLVRIEASGICGRDVMEWYRISKAPLVLGHEIAGEVVAVGEGVTRYREGNRVSVAHHVPCNTCHYCLNDHHTVCDTLRQTNFDPGGFAEYVRLPAINVDRGVYLLPDEVSFEEGTFTEPLACILRGQRMAGIRPGQSVLIIGCGMSGLLHLEMARAQGAGRILATDVAEYRLEAARRFGADVAIHAQDDIPARVREANRGHLADRVLVCTGATSAVLQALQCVDRGGTILFFAPTGPGVTIPISINEFFFRNDITLTTSYAGSPADYTLAVELIRSRKVRVQEMITHRLRLAEASQGFQLVAQAQDSIKVILEPQR
ncbi:MAG: alcohol dehydrogenase catalytic domain-containing protein [Candidatus Tectomicrobia bacterium]|uniref:Alcohol dehydrogenase catalytic domain-containing protein n=1 Tax=Tectimicrobiota bacterium TaxID=2528274 RepID=A0A932CQX8_UNCTE|nr:alcohol dehydrogenase catalytic domain-containing protein [Candidatus Tectomicrobia bacterium]